MYIVSEALCQFFLNLSGKYSFVEQLDDIGKILSLTLKPLLTNF